MVKKQQKAAAKKKSGAGASPSDSHLAGSVKESAQQIWLAGMGAFAKAQAEGGKVFDTLVKEGTRLQRKTQSVAEEKLGDVGSRMSNLASEASSKAGASWDKLESLFEERTGKALAKLGMSTRHDVAALTRRVDDLAAAVARLAKSTKPARRAASAEAAPTPVKRSRKTSARSTAPASAGTTKPIKSTKTTKASKTSKTSGQPRAKSSS